MALSIRYLRKLIFDERRQLLRRGVGLLLHDSQRRLPSLQETKDEAKKSNSGSRK
jgi:hypothetical protein